jgi:hypothetical protein
MELNPNTKNQKKIEILYMEFLDYLIEQDKINKTNYNKLKKVGKLVINLLTPNASKNILLNHVGKFNKPIIIKCLQQENISEQEKDPTKPLNLCHAGYSVYSIYVLAKEMYNSQKEKDKTKDKYYCEIEDTIAFFISLLWDTQTKNSEKHNFLGLLEPYPTSPALHNLQLIFNGMGKTRQTRVNRNTKLDDWTTENGEYTATFKNKQSTTTITVENVSEITKKYDKHLKKIFVFLLQKANRVQFNEANFSLSELVENGIYSNEDSARRGLKRIMNKLTSIKISGEFKKGKNIIKSGLYVMFTALEIEKGFCTITINPKINTEFVAQFFTLLPNWIYKLSNKAFTLAEYIFYLARQNAKNIKNKGYFNISFNAINDYLQQPTPKETLNHTRDIIDPILESITEIENKQQGTDYKFTPIYNQNYKNAVDFLKDGYIKIDITN